MLLTTLGGTTYDWVSPFIVGLGILAVAALVAFVVVERRAEEPVLAPELFANPVFRITSAIGFVVGFALFGALTYLPLFQQVVRGLSPTAAGLQLLPLMAGLLMASIGSGQVITRTGRYRWFPILGTAIAAAGMLLLSRLDATTGTGEAAAYMFVLGVGLGLTMQVLVLAVQNAVPYAQLGMATSSATLFRSIGGSLGTAILGAIFANRLSHELSAGARTLDTGSINPARLDSLPGPQRDAYVGAFTDSLSTVFVIAGAVVAVAFVAAWFLEERPLRRTIEETTVGEAFAPPQDTDSLHEITTQLSRLVGRERTRRFIQGVIEEADVEMTPAEAWLLGRVDDGEIPAEALAVGDDQDRVRLAKGAQRLRERGVVDGGDGLQLTEAGTGLRERLLTARRRRLASLVADWEPEAPEVDAMIARLSEEVERSGSA